MILIHLAVEVATCGRPSSHLRLSFLFLRSMSTGKKRVIEELWCNLFSNPSEWWDHRPEKINPRFPDFKHKQTGESLWLAHSRNPPWVQAKLAALPPGTLQSNHFTWAQRLRRYVKAGQYKKTMEVFYQMQHERICPSTWTFLPVLNACAGLGSLDDGKCVHSHIRQVGCESDVYVATCLVDMYAKCGSIKDAWNVFGKMREHDVVAWNAMIGGFVKSGHGLKALELFLKMQVIGVEPNAITFVAVLNACASIAAFEEGRRVHEQIIQQGCESHVYVANCLVDMYAKCGSIEDAWSVFKKMQEHNVISWNAMIGGYTKSGKGHKAMELFRAMQLEGVDPDAVTFVAVLHACASVAALEEGKHVHKQIVQRGCESNVSVANCIVDMYAKCGSIQDAWIVFNKMEEHTVVSWNVIIGCFVKSGQGLKAIECFHEMQQEGVDPDSITFVGVLNACASVAALEEGRRIHEQIIRKGCALDVYVATSLVDMYAKCGSIGDAWGVFNMMQNRDVVSWDAMIGGCVKSGQALKALELFTKMHLEGVEPNTITYAGVLNACSSIAALEEGRRVHEQIIQRGCESDVYVANSLVGMYAKCGSTEDALIVFNKMQERNVVSWNAMIGGYVKSEQGLKAMELFRKMKLEGVEPDTVTFLGVLNACANIMALEKGRCVHDEIIQRGYNSDVFVATCLVDMYAKCGSIEDAWSVFNKMGKHNVVSWNAIIGGYVKAGHGLKALELFMKMQVEGVEPDVVTVVELLNACASVAALDEGRRVHEQIIQNGWQSDVFVANCLVDMYAKCGSIKDAWSVFTKMQGHDVISWNAMIWGFMNLGKGLKVMELFKEMQQEGVEPDAVTFMGVLNACASVAAFEQGRHVHQLTIQKGLDSDVSVSNCLVDMYAKCGSIEDAERVFNKMLTWNMIASTAMIGGYAMHGHAKKAIVHFQQMGKKGVDINGVTFTCLLSACSHGGLVKEGLRYFKSMISCFHIFPFAEHYACMVDLLGRAGRLKEAEELIQRMPVEENICVWTSFLSACTIHGDMEMAEWVARRCRELDAENASGKWDRNAAL